jgi:hypothetical protein
MAATLFRGHASLILTTLLFFLVTSDYSRQDAVRLVFARTLFTTSEWLWRDLETAEHQEWIGSLLALQSAPAPAEAPEG